MTLFKACITYDGTSFFGWQKTKSGPSIQQALEDAVFRITGKSTEIEAASRTDRGVHARGQIVAFALGTSWEEKTLKRALNAVLPAEIRVLKVEELKNPFHPTLEAIAKEYHYELCLQPFHNPLTRLYSWHVYFPLDLKAMQQGAPLLLGTHDFSSFSGEKEKNPICTVEKIQLESTENHLRIVLKADRFLYKMARILAGTLYDVGKGILPKESLSQILEAKSRKQAGVTAPAHGLFLHEVLYAVA